MRFRIKQATLFEKAGKFAKSYFHIADNRVIDIFSLISKKAQNRKGYILMYIIVFGSITIYFLVSFISWAAMSIKASRQAVNRERALQIAEAGVDYYRWHLAHSPSDFQDGTGAAGPYLHNFTDKDGNIIGQFSLDITPPTLGSSLAVLKSTGKVAGDTVERNITVKFAKPSIAKYAVAANDVMRFGEGTEIFGPIHSNQGVRFDGLAHNVITSAVASYNDPDHTGANEFGVHTHHTAADPLPPAAVPQRTDVFEVGREFPVPAIDFTGITADLADLKTAAVSGGFYRPSAGALGYHIVLRTDGTFDLYRITKLINAPSGCTNSQSQSGWGTWSIDNQHLIGNFPLPNNGIIFLEDDIFIDGQIDGARLTIVAAFLPDNPPFRKNIIINNDLLYAHYDGTDVIGLIAQGNINIGFASDDDLRIDAALIAQNGRVGRYYYSPSKCTTYHTRQTLTLWGMIATNQRYGFAYTDNTGYLTRNLNYDGSLLYGPPPNFPLTSDEYVTLSWEAD